MRGVKTDPITVGRVLESLEAGKSERRIIAEMKKKGIKVTKGVINRIKNPKPKPSPKKKNKSPNFNWFSTLDRNKMKRLKNMAEDQNPPTQTHMGKVLGCTQQNISHHINKTLNMKIRRKSLIHALSEKNIENRRRWSPDLYKTLNNQKYKKLVTTDETWFYMTNCNGKRRIQYVSHDQKHSKELGTLGRMPLGRMDTWSKYTFLNLFISVWGHFVENYNY